MEMSLQLTVALGLLVAGIELWRFLVVSVFTLIIKAGLMTNITVDPLTKISVLKATANISFWTNFWTFIWAPTREKLVALELSCIHVVVVKSTAEMMQQRGNNQVSSYWQTLDTSFGFTDIRHPMWKKFRKWIPRLMFLCRCSHFVEWKISSMSVDFTQSDNVLLSIQHGSVVIKTMFCTETKELACIVTLSQTRPMQFTLRALDGTAALGCTEIRFRIPISQDMEDVRAPIPSINSVMIGLIEVNLDFQRLVTTILHLKLQQQSGTTSFTTNTIGSSVETNLHRVMTVLHLAEICPNDLHVKICRLEVNAVDKTLPHNSGSSCALELNNLNVKLQDTIPDEGGPSNSKKDLEVIRKGELALGLLTVHLNEEDGQRTAKNVSSIVKMSDLQLSGECTLLAKATISNTFEESDENDNKHAVLCVRSLISGESPRLDVILSKSIEPWVASYSAIYDREAIKMQPTDSYEYIHNAQKWSLMDYGELQLDIHFKLLKSYVTLMSLDRTCAVLPDGVPSLNLSLGEISVYGYPFVCDSDFGVRAKADIQCSRLTASCSRSSDMVKFPFLYLDFIRVLLSPVGTKIQNERHGEVEMQVDWVEVKWSAEVMHAIGGALELGIFTLASFLHESRHLKAETTKPTPRMTGWKRACTSVQVPPMRQMGDITREIGTSDKCIAFRCTARQICVLFPYVYDEQHKVDYVTVDTFKVSVDDVTGRLGISILHAAAFASRRMSEQVSFISAKTFSHTKHHDRQNVAMRRTVRSQTKPTRIAPDEIEASNDDDMAFLVADFFFLEENKLEKMKTVVDLFADGVRIEWDILTQLRVLELVRRVTYSSWEMIYRARSAYAIHCSPSTSIYNRTYGLNPPLDDLDECLRYEKLFKDLISASGGTLHRLYATNISVRAKLGEEVQLHLDVGVFGGDDLPEVWRFEDVSLKLNELEMIGVDTVHVRHTLDKQASYVFGEFEDMLRQRLAVCKRSTEVLDQNSKDGMLIDIGKLQLCTTCTFPLQSYAEAVQRIFHPFKERLGAAMASYWRPQQDLFYQYFLRTPVVSQQKEIWLHLDDVRVVCLGDPLESWLEKMYPVWLKELAERELRAHMLHDHIAALELTTISDVTHDELLNKMEMLLTEKNARLYLKTVKKMKAAAVEAHGALINVHVGPIDVDVSFDKDITEAWPSIQELDEATQAIKNAVKAVEDDPELFTPSCRLFVGIHVKLELTNLSVQIRQFPTPLVTCESLGAGGQIYLTAYDSGYDDAHFDLTAAIRCFVNLSVDIISPNLSFSPGYLYALDELATLVVGLLPLVILDIDKRNQTSPIDIARRLLHGKVVVLVKKASLRLLNTTNVFKYTDFLEMTVHQVCIAYSCSSIDIDVTRVAVKIEPDSVSHLAELSHLKVQIWLKWNAKGDPSMHYMEPIMFIGAKNASRSGGRFVLRLLDASPHNASSTNAFDAYQATQLSVFISGRICPSDFEQGIRGVAAGTAIVLYSQSVEWMIRFARVYHKLPPIPLPQRRNNGEKQRHIMPSTNLFDILEGVIVEKFEIIGLEMALYESETHRVGIRAFIDDKISCFGAVLKRSHEVFFDPKSKNSATNDLVTSSRVRRLSFHTKGSNWILHDVHVNAREIQVRGCTPESGSRGESLVSIESVSLIVGGGTEQLPAHDDSFLEMSMSSLKRVVLDAQLSSSFPSTTNEMVVKARSKQNILEYFDIPYENPFAYRDDVEVEIGEYEAIATMKTIEESPDEVVNEFRQSGYLLGLLSTEIRVTLTMVALESLIDMADTWTHVIVTSLPELFHEKVEAAALRDENKDMASCDDRIQDGSDQSSKKCTSLAQDPKFKGISLQGGAATRVHRQEFEPTPFSNAETVRPSAQRRSKDGSPFEILPLSRSKMCKWGWGQILSTPGLFEMRISPLYWLNLGGSSCIF